MHDKVQKQLISAVFVVLKPIAKILLSYGVGFRELAEIAKTAFVDVATTEYGIRGRPTNISRVAVMTGLTRKEVRRIRDKIDRGDYTSAPRTSTIWNVIEKWHTDPHFSKAPGKPKPLSFSSGEHSFAELVRKYGGDIPPGAMRTELKRFGIVSEQDDGTLSVLKRTVEPDADAEGLIDSLRGEVPALLWTISHNMESAPNSRSPVRFEYAKRVLGRDMPGMRRATKSRIDDCAKSFEDIYTAYGAISESDICTAQDTSTVGVGIFYYEGSDVEMDPTASSKG